MVSTSSCQIAFYLAVGSFPHLPVSLGCSQTHALIGSPQPLSSSPLLLLPLLLAHVEPNCQSVNSMSFSRVLSPTRREHTDCSVLFLKAPRSFLLHSFHTSLKEAEIPESSTFHIDSRLHIIHSFQADEKKWKNLRKASMSRYMYV